MKRISVLAGLLLLISCTALNAKVIASGKYTQDIPQANILWSLTDDGTMTIEDFGNMGDWENGGLSDKKCPWSEYMNKITRVIIGNDIEYIGQNSFFGCTNLTEVSLPDRITIGRNAFGHCTFNEITIPSGSILRPNAFYRCDVVNRVIVPKGFPDQFITQGFGECNDNFITNIYDSEGKKLNVQNVIPITWHLSDDGILTISGEGRMEDSKHKHDFMKHVVPVGVSNDMPWGDKKDQIWEVVIGEGITYIAAGAFFACGNITKVTLPESVVEIGYSAFRGTPRLTSITLPNGMTKIGSGALWGSSIAEITIPETVAEIGDYAFYDCEYMESISIPDGVTSIGAHAFESSGITSISLPGSVTSIGDYAFASTGITGISLPESLTKLGAYAFSNCNNLTSVILPEGVTVIKEGTFAGCDKLRHVTLPVSVTRIEEKALDAEQLINITIPANVRYIGEKAFSSFNSMYMYLLSLSVEEELLFADEIDDIVESIPEKQIHIRATTPPIIESNTIQQKVTAIYVPEESLDAYRRAPYWRDHADIIIGE